MTEALAAARSRVSTTALEWIGLVSILAAAAVLRLVSLPTRGTWDADQGHDMLVLRDFVQQGQIPLLGPPTSIGDFHHGVLYYFLLAPAAALSGIDPTAVTLWIAIAGIAAVGVTFWLGRSIGGPVAGLVAGLLMAVSASAVDESTFIWNPNLIALSSAIALATAWHAWQARRPRWWIAAGGAAIVTMHLHVLGILLTPVVAGLLIADLVRRQRDRDAAGVGAVVASVGWWIVLFLLSYIPLAVHEATTGGSELRAALAFLTAGEPASVSLPARLPIVALRVLGWPLTGLITDAPLATIASATVVVILTIWRGWFSHPGSVASAEAEQVALAERTGVRWLGLGLLWTVAGLTVGASSLATVVIGLPNDHYHAFADPMVFVLVGVGVAALIRIGLRADGRWARPVRAVASVLAAAIVVLLVGWNIVHQPPAVAADGGWPAGQAAAERILVATGGGPVILDSLPAAKSADAVRFPLEALVPGIVQEPGSSPGGATGGASGSPARVVLCDQLFHETIGAACGGPAEDAWIAAALGSGSPPPTVVDRFEAAPGRWVTVYRVGA